MQITPGEGNYGPAKIVIPAPQDSRYAHLGWPKMIKTKDGTIYLAYISGSEHTKQGCPVITTSTDMGRTFADPVRLADYDQQTYVHVGNVALGVADDGSIVLLAMALTATADYSAIFGWRSEDGGESWQQVNTSSLSGSVYGRLFTVPSRGLAVVGHLRKGSSLGDTGLWIAYSTNCGRSFGSPQLITDKHLYEPAFLYTEGKIIGLAKGPSTRGYLQFVSVDLGIRWSVLQTGIGNQQDMTSPSLFVDPNDSARLYAFETQRHKTPVSQYPGHMTLWVGDTTTYSFSRLGPIALFGSRTEEALDYGYPWMVPLDHGRWFCVFYCGQPIGTNHIWGLEIEGI